MSLVLWLLVGTLATARLASLLARERGPFAVMTRLRAGFGVHHLPDGTPDWQDGELLFDAVTPWARVDDVLHEVALMLTCTWCNSLWIAPPVALALGRVAPVITSSWAAYLLVVLALSKAAILVEGHL